MRCAPPLGTIYDEHCRSWVVIRVGTGYIIEPRSVGVDGPGLTGCILCASSGAGTRARGDEHADP
jgi:hypothetical protein